MTKKDYCIGIVLVIIITILIFLLISILTQNVPYKSGDFVYHKLNNQKMLVVKSNIYFCTVEYIDIDGKIRTRSFRYIVLKSTESEK